VNCTDIKKKKKELAKEVSTPQEAIQYIENHMEGCGYPGCLVCFQKRAAVNTIRKTLKMPPIKRIAS
jgi:hypothetical protein